MLLKILYHRFYLRTSLDFISRWAKLSKLLVPKYAKQTFDIRDSYAIPK